MNTIDSIATPVMTTGRLVNAYVQEAKSECLRYLRNPGFLLPTLLFPSVFYLMLASFSRTRTARTRRVTCLRRTARSA